MRNIISAHRERVAQMEKQLLAQETATRAKNGISQACQIADDGRSFLASDGQRPCPDALPPVSTLVTKGDPAQKTTNLKELKEEKKQ